MTNSNEEYEEYRCWCEQCDWEDTAPNQEAAAKLINLGHGVSTGHHRTYMKPLGDSSDE